MEWVRRVRVWERQKHYHFWIISHSHFIPCHYLLCGYSIEKTSFLRGKILSQFNLVQNPKLSRLNLPVCSKIAFTSGPLSVFLLDKVFPLSPALHSFSKHTTRGNSQTPYLFGHLLNPWRLFWDHVLSLNRFFQDPLPVSEADCPLIFGELK